MREYSVHELWCIGCLFIVCVKVEIKALGFQLCHYAAAMGTSGACGGCFTSETPRFQNMFVGLCEMVSRDQTDLRIRSVCTKEYAPAQTTATLT